MPKFYEWESLDDFNTWHESIMALLGIPNETTLNYTTYREISGKIIATVENEHAQGLKETNLRPDFIL